MVFTFQSPGISPALWGQADGNDPALRSILHNRKSQQGKCPNVITPTLPRHYGDNQKVIVQHLTPAIPRLSSYVGAVDINDWCIILFKYCINKKANKTKWSKSCIFLTRRYLEVTNNRNILNTPNVTLK